MTTHIVFCYGTLRKGQSNHAILNGARCIEEHCWTKGKLFDTYLGYPVFTHSIPTDNVYGELYEVTDEGLVALDELEGFHGEDSHDNLYERIVQEVYTTTGEMKASVYIEGKNQDLCKQYISSGDWNEYCTQSEHEK
ncbi:gamma-glutamylcyclotransferase family protein [Pontibacillus litoralis]|uniref:Gamma-glutamylcyclotransferase family protein n=1 Tax=Pontibacillus litoralis JSM 072002 TaxID=1385512 RepID=A0A0A5G8U7_9BACI|nr:gamma-glutamylcyclotransferase family protein [Pontibacillus litoralis]KGX87515.1 hypothetical protein N784_14815 [Pontibacillus litoralis JSM 072002]